MPHFFKAASRSNLSQRLATKRMTDWFGHKRSLLNSKDHPAGAELEALLPEGNFLFTVAATLRTLSRMMGGSQ